jgi:hypothetical protein
MNFRSLFWAFFIVLSTTPGKAQTWAWSVKAGGIKSDKASHVRTDASGNIYVCGYYNGYATFGSIAVQSNYPTDKHIFVAKYNASGNIQWVATGGGMFDDRALGMDVDKAGNIYITGTFWDQIQFGPFNVTDLSGNTCCDQTFIAKLSPNGNWIWAKWAGGVYFTGFYSRAMRFGTIMLPSPPLGDTLLYVAKMDSAGNFLWARHFGGGDGERDNAITVDQNQNVYVAGGFRGTRTFGTVQMTSVDPPDRDIFVVKYDGQGNFQWARQAGGDKDDRANGIASDNLGNIYLTGEFKDSAYFGTILLDNYNKRDIFVARMDVAGNWIWAAKAGGSSGDERGNSIYADRSGRIYVTGSYGHNAFFGSSVFPTGTDSLNIFAARISPGGNWLWVATAGGSTSSERGTDIYPGQGPDVYVTGHFQQSTKFGSNPTLISDGKADIFLAKLLDPLLGTEDEFPSFEANLYPNPFINPLYLSLNLSKSETLQIEVLDVSGRNLGEIHRGKFDAGNHLIPLQTENLGLSPGIYFVRISVGTKTTLVKLIKAGN